MGRGVAASFCASFSSEQQMALSQRNQQPLRFRLQRAADGAFSVQPAFSALPSPSAAERFLIATALTSPVHWAMRIGRRVTLGSHWGLTSLVELSDPPNVEAPSPPDAHSNSATNGSHSAEEDDAHADTHTKQKKQTELTRKSEALHKPVPALCAHFLSTSDTHITELTILNIVICIV